MSRRPLLILLIPYTLGLLLADWIDFPAPVWLGLVFAWALFLFLLVSRSRPRWQLGCLMLIVLVAGWANLEKTEQEFRSQSILHILHRPVRCGLWGRVVSEPERRPGRLRAVVRVDSVQIGARTLHVSGRVLCHWRDSNGRLEPGDRFFARGTLTAPDGQRNPGEFDYREYLRRKNIAGLFYTARQAPIILLSHPGRDSLLGWLFSRPRRRIARMFEEVVLPHENAVLLKALILGVRGELSPKVRERFASTGTVHILAVSGLHVGFVMLFLFGLAWLLRLRDPWKSLFVMLALAYYAGLTGFKAPVLRATLMADLFLLGRLLQRDADIYNILAGAALAILIVRPQELFSVGFQLSFAAVFGIVFLFRKLQPLLLPQTLTDPKGPLAWLAKRGLELLLVSFCAQLATLPLTAIYFERVPLVASFANLVVVPLTQVIVSLGFLLIPPGLFLPPAAAYLGKTLSALLQALTGFVALLSRFEVLRLDTAPLGHAGVLFLWAAGLFLLWMLLRRRFGYVLIGLLLVLNFFVWRPVLRGNNVHVIFLDVGQGDAALVYRPSQWAFLVDAGPLTERYDAGKQTILPLLRRKGIRQLDAIFLSHPHSDHIGGVPYLLRHLPVSVIYTIDAEDEEFRPDYRPLCDSLGVPIRFLYAGDFVPGFAPARIWVLSPVQAMMHDSRFNTNCKSLVLKIQVGTHAFLFCGDLERETERALLPWGKWLHADVLKVAHHGSITSSDPQFLLAVSPAWGVISVGKWNSFGHPSSLVLNRLRALGASVLRTDENGAVIFQTDGKHLKRLR